MRRTRSTAAAAFLLVLCMLISACGAPQSGNGASSSSEKTGLSSTADNITASALEESGTRVSGSPAVSPDTGGQTSEPVTVAPLPGTSLPVTASGVTPSTGPATSIPATGTPDRPETEPVTSAITTDEILTATGQTDAPQTSAATSAATSAPVTSAVTTAPATTKAQTSAPVTEPPAPKPVKVSKITLSASDTTVYIGRTVTLTVSVTPDNADDKSVTFSVSSGSKYVSVDRNGVVTGLKEGKGTIKATANDGSGKYATITITVKEAPVLAGSGSKSDPYLVANADDLKNLSKFLSKKDLYFRQTADIDLSGEVWTPIGNEDKPFMSNYDGCGFVISGLTLPDEISYAGLFGMTDGGTLTGITVTGLSNEGSLLYNAGGLAGMSYVTLITDCRVDGELRGSGYLGMLVGSYNGTFKGTPAVKNCSVSGKIYAESSYVGGMVGSVDYSYDRLPEEYDYVDCGVDFYGCTAAVDIEGATSEVGGLIGYIRSGNIEKCSASGNILTCSGRDRGGLIGQLYEYSEVSRCFATGSVTATGSGKGDAMCGGLIGYMLSRNSVHDCYATGDVSSASMFNDCQDHTTYNGGLSIGFRNPCGALIGLLYAVSGSEKITVYNCYATGKVTNPYACVDDFANCSGSLIGWVYDNATVRYLINSEYKAPSSMLFNSKYNIDITEEMLTGTIIGRLENNYCVSTSSETFTCTNYIVKNSNQTAYVGQYKSLPSFRVVTNIVLSALTDRSVFAGFDFTNVWIMGETGPELR